MKYIFILIIIFNIIKLSANPKQSEIVNRNNKFAFSLFSKINEIEKGNILISPFSISVAMSMCYDGAAGFTAREIRKVMNFDRNRSLSHQQFTDLLKFYQISGEEYFKIANAAVSQEKYNFLDSYFEILKNYNALLKTADFTTKTGREKALMKINEWVAENTEQKITELIDESAIDDMTRLILLNAIYFKANWENEFLSERTFKSEFYSPEGRIKADFMRNQLEIQYFENEKMQMIELPYKNNVASMFIIIPDEKTNINDFADQFCIDRFETAKATAQNSYIDLRFPKFKLEKDYQLKQVFMEMGMQRAFSLRANLRRMTGRRDLMVDDIIHKTFIEVDEKGTEASAATAVIIREKSAPRAINVNINRPFLFIIQENEKKTVMFVGKIIKPIY